MCVCNLMNHIYNWKSTITDHKANLRQSTLRWFVWREENGAWDAKHPWFPYTLYKLVLIPVLLDGSHPHDSHLMFPPQGMASGRCGDPPATDALSENESHSVVYNSLRPHGLCSPRNSPGQNTGVGSLSLLQGIFPTQGSKSGLPYCRRILYQLSHKGRPRILEWVAYPFSSGSSPPRNRTGVSCITVRFFTNWAIREAQVSSSKWQNWLKAYVCQT